MAQDLIDYCHSDLGTELVAIDTAFQDGLEPENLLKNGLSDKAKGFQVASFVRPPVVITLKFANHISLSHIEYQSRTCSLIEWSASRDGNCFEVIGKQVNPSQTTVLKNYYFPGNGASIGDRPQSEVRLRAPQKDRFLLRETKSVRLRILRTTNSSVAQLNSLKIYGKSCQSDLEKWREILNLRKAESACPPRFFTQFADTSPCTTSQQPQISDNKPAVEPKEANDLESNANTKDVKVNETEVVPREFLDAITLELMQIPMVLPSGQVVDKGTIDKHDLNESRFGRLPNDPFTGKPYTDQLKPQLDSTLKSRIDTFCLARNGLKINQVLKRNRLVSTPQEAPICSSSKFRRLDDDTYSGQAAAAVSNSSNNSGGSSVLSNLLKNRTLILSKKEFDGCSVCGAKEKDYSITACTHFLCKDCARKLTASNKCSKCNVHFSKSQVVRNFR